jgi:glutaredoxin
MKIEIYSKDNCPYCDKAKNLLEMKSMEFEEYKLDKDFSREEILEWFSGVKTFPIITLDKKYIGGYNELYDLLLTY